MDLFLSGQNFPGVFGQFLPNIDASAWANFPKSQFSKKNTHNVNLIWSVKFTKDVTKTFWC